jgi:hypothetical protein
LRSLLNNNNKGLGGVMNVEPMFGLSSVKGILDRMAMIVVGIFVVFGGQNVSSAPPDFAAIDDILGGRRIMLPVDDLVMTSFNGQSDNSVNNLILQTEDSQPVQGALYNIIFGDRPRFVEWFKPWFVPYRLLSSVILSIVVCGNLLTDMSNWSSNGTVIPVISHSTPSLCVRIPFASVEN